MTTTSSPWHIVFSLIRSFEDGLALIALFEYQDRELMANGCSLTEILDGILVSERSVAERIAAQLRELTGDSGWTYGNFYRPTRGCEATAEEISQFVARCREGGVTLHYDDGSPAAPPRYSPVT